MSSGVVPKALETYREAWRDFQLGGSTAALSEPRQIAYRPPLASASRSRADRDTVEEHFVVVSFTVAKDGHTADVVVTESDAGESQQKAVTSAVRKALYAPRFEGGEPVETQGVTFRERMLSKKQRAPKD
jgi:outer membrane biosynthesis protein TonB